MMFLHRPRCWVGAVRPVSLAGVLWVACLGIASPRADERGAPPPADLFDLVAGHRLDQLLALAGAELDSAEIPIARKLDLLRALASAHLAEAEARGDAAHRESARSAMIAMLKLDPQADFVPGYRFPPQVHALFRKVRDESRAGEEIVADPRRVAVAPFYLVDLGASGRFDWREYCEALTFMITTDLDQVPGLTILSREHMESIRGELALSSQADLVSAENRIRLQRLLSASSFVYGEVQALPGDEIYLEVRWVQTESGAVLAAYHDRARIRKGADLLELEHGVILDGLLPAMLEGLGLTRAGAGVSEVLQRKLAQAAKGDTYLHYIAAVARATTAEQSGDMAEALRQWGAASRDLPADAAPAERIRALKMFYEGADSDSLLNRSSGG